MKIPAKVPARVPADETARTANRVRKRRFIAGALCPACGEADKMVVWESSTGLQRECVDCGFLEQSSDGSGATVLPESSLAGDWHPVRISGLMDGPQGED